MMIDRIESEFVEFIPDQLAPGTLYISMEYATASHLCCCGCGEKVVTPFTPTDWRMTFDGETVSLHPSIGNWEQACQTHYVIDRNSVVEHGPWTRSEVKNERERDRRTKASHYGNGEVRLPVEPNRPTALRRKTLWESIKDWIVRI